MAWIIGVASLLIAFAVAWFRLFKVASLDNQPVVATVTVSNPSVTNDASVAQDNPKPDMILTWASAITHWEGANPLNCNPGNLKWSTLTASWGAQKGPQASDGGYLCHFPTYTAGFKALVDFLTLAAEGELIISNPRPCTLDAFTTRYAGNPPLQYKQGIADMLGVPLTVDISTFLPKEGVS